ncbi:MAG: PTS transporter subunit EIIC [Mycoplasmataceae bacterium]|nr:PTS transporter subunit EIIC [Mycoplasmataceae bacterium]
MIKNNLPKTKTKTKIKNESKWAPMAILQNIGKSLIFPIATLPAAALLMRIGAFIGSYGDMAGNGGEQFAYWLGFIVQTPGQQVFDWLPLIFGIGIAFGFADENRGEVALVAAIGYFALVGLAQNKDSMSTLLYQNVNLGNGLTISYDAAGNMMGASQGGETWGVTNPDVSIGESSKYFSDVLFLNIFVRTDALSGGATTTWLINFGVFGGMVVGLVSAVLYDRFSNVRLHPALGFFSGRRFVPIVTLVLMILVAFGFAIIWPWISITLVYFSLGISHVPAIGAGLYTFANRLLIPFGLHQVLNSYFWFQAPVLVNGSQLFITGTGINDTAQLALGDLISYSLIKDGAKLSWIFNGSLVEFFVDMNKYELVQATGTLSAADGLDQLIDARIGMYQSGFFPTMMFGLPAIGIAIALKSEKEHKKAVWAFMGSAAAVAFLTGITEPLEFAFMFISPLIYVTYAALSSIWGMITVLLNISIGFGFSAGAIDFILSIIGGQVGLLSYAGNWAILEMIIIGAIAFIINGLAVYFLIEKLNISTPGRNGNIAGLVQGQEDKKGKTKLSKKQRKGKISSKLEKMAKSTIKHVGAENIEKVENCITRVRLTVKDNSSFDKDEAIKIGYTGAIKVGKKAYQLVIGPDSEVIANEIKRLLSEK